MLEDFGAVPVGVEVYLECDDGPAFETSPFRHRGGWLMAAEARLSLPFAARRRTLVACITDQGEMMPPAMANRLLDMSMSLPFPVATLPPDELAEFADALFWDFLGTSDLDNLQLLEDEREKTEARMHEFIARCGLLQGHIERHERAMRVERRQSATTVDRRARIDADLARASSMSDELRQGMRGKLAAFRANTDALEDAVMAGLTEPGEVETLYVVRWDVRRLRSGADFHPPLYKEGHSERRLGGNRSGRMW